MVFLRPSFLFRFCVQFLFLLKKQDIAARFTQAVTHIYKYIPMRFRHLLSIVLLLVYTAGFSKQIGPETAEKVALGFIKLRTTSPELKSVNDLDLVHIETSAGNQWAALTQGINYYYVFNIGQHGFILMSADDRVIPVLGYSEEGIYEDDDVSPQFAKWMDGYKSQIREAIVNEMPATAEITSEWNNLSIASGGLGISKRGSVSPLLSVQWDQRPYYNAQCPYDNTYSERTVTGCVATAMAQVMKYWSYPSTGTGSHSYSHGTYGTLSANFGSSTYNWSSMPSKLTSNNSEVAKLMYHLGVSVDMNYNVASQGGSGAFVISAASAGTNCTEYALKTYFGYKSSLSGIQRKDYTNTQWLNTLKTELDASRPIIYAGFGSGGGHCFVADGYDANDYIHFNWGWGGAYDGYFSINALNPGGVGTGGGTGGFNTGHQAVIGIQPDNNNGGSANIDLRLYSDITVDPDPVTYQNGFTVTVNVANYGTSTSQNFTGDYTAAVFNSDNQFVAFVETLTGMSLDYNKYYVNPLVFTTTGIGALTPGDYYIGIYHKKTGASQWTAMGAGNYQNFVSFTVEGNQTNDLRLYAAITATPSVITRNKAFSIDFDVANYGGTDFTGDITIDIHKSDGTWIRELSSVTNVTLPSLTHFQNGLTFSLSKGIDDEPGTYQLMVWSKRTGGSWEMLGSGTYSNPINVQVVNPAINPDQYENNNTLAAAYALPFVFSSNAASRLTTGSNCHNGSDYDYYKIVLPSGYNYKIDARLQDAFSTTDGNTYTLDAQVSYSTDGVSWSESFDDAVTQISQNGGGTLYFFVSPRFTGYTGTYRLDIASTRTPVTSVEASSVKVMNVYPNPSKGMFTISGNGAMIKSYNLVDVTGQLVMTGQVGSKEEVLVETGKLAPGVYSLQVISEEGTYTQSIVVQ